MSHATASLIVSLGRLYVLFGLLPALAFVLVGAGRIDAGARGTSPAFRVVILPGALLLWPLVLRRWLGAPRKAAAGSRP